VINACHVYALGSGKVVGLVEVSVAGPGLDVSVRGAGPGVSVVGAGLAVSGSAVVVGGRDVWVRGSSVDVESAGGVFEVGGGVKVFCPSHATMNNTSKRINCLIILTIVHVRGLNIHNLV
jgi:hypothetical protein